MPEIKSLDTDIERIAKLRELSASGQLAGPSSYFNHLLDVYGRMGRAGGKRSFTERERERVDLFLASFRDVPRDPSHQNMLGPLEPQFAAPEEH
jgi:hypothetical protein